MSVTVGRNQSFAKLASIVQNSAMARGILSRHLSAVLADLRVLLKTENRRTVLREARMDGVSILVKANEDVGRQIYFAGRYEVSESDYLAQAIRETDVCLDIGANIGYYTLLLAKLAKRGEVHSFEPVPMNVHLLNLNVLANRFTNVHVNANAVADVEGEEEFNVCEDAAYSSFRDTERKSVQEHLRVITTTLDAYRRSRGLSRIDFVKIDVEGAEERVIAGASETLSNPAQGPRLLMMELYEPMLRRYSSSIRQMVLRMQQYGYAPFVYVRGRIIPFNAEHHNGFYNIFFLR